MEPLSQPCPTCATHLVLRDFEDQCPGLVVGDAGCVEEVAGGSKVNHAVVIRGEGQWQRREGDGGAVGQGVEFTLGGGREVEKGCK